MSDSTRALLIGVDGGGTRCRAAIGTLADGVIARAEGGQANATSDRELAIRNIISSVQAAAQQADIGQEMLRDATAHIGIAGVLTPEDSALIAAALPFKRSVVTDDRPTAVTGALGNKDGYLLSLGTGTIAAASRAGTFEYVGGWGFSVSDHGSGAWLGRSALEQVLLCYDGLADHTALTIALFAKFDNDPNAVATFSMAAAPGDFGTFAPEVIARAQDADAWGQSIMRQAAKYLARSLDRLGFQPGDTLCLTGGVGPHYAGYLPATYLTGRVDPVGTALDGAFQLVKRHLTQSPESHP